MLNKQPTILALDFDGVLCDGLIEYFQTAWQAYCQLWQPSDTTPPSDLEAQFCRLRPVIETGWEMPVLIHALLSGVPEAEILSDWGTLAPQLAEASGLTSTDIAAQVDQIRDQWIARDLDHWLSQHRFYPGIVERLQTLLTEPVQVVIITTKEGRFVRQLLQRQHINLPETQIFGKEVKQPKAATLKKLLLQPQPDRALPQIWFVEDRLKTLQSIRTSSDLDRVQLFLADWGYNLPSDRDLADRTTDIHLLSLSTFAQELAAWY